MSESWMTRRWTTLLVRGVVGVVFGVLFMAHPGTAAPAIAFVLGILAFAWGLVFIVVAFAVRDRTTSAYLDVALG